jgi:hypothetical protein
MQTARSIPGLAAGLFLFDLLINLPGLSAASPVASLLIPSIDLLVVAAALLGVSQAGEQARVPLRVVVSVLLMALLAWEAATRFGADEGLPTLGYLLGGAAALAAGALSYVSAGPVLRGFSFPMVRSLFVVVVALLAVLQVVSGQHVLAPSVVPRLFRAVASLFRSGG